MTRWPASAQLLGAFYISPISRLYLRYISPISRYQVGSTTQVGTWSLERSGCPSAEPAASLGNQPASTGPCGPYWAGLQGVSAFQHADTLLAIDALLGAGVAGIFSDFPAAVSAVANCRSANTT